MRGTHQLGLSGPLFDLHPAQLFAFRSFHYELEECFLVFNPFRTIKSLNCRNLPTADIMAPTAEYRDSTAAAFGEPITFPIQYEDPEYQSAHSNLFSGSLTRPLEAVLPPGVAQADFDAAINKLKGILGKDHVFTGRSLTEYIDPYELQEDPSRRKIPSGAVW
jgi:hypothetical protein